MVSILDLDDHREPPPEVVSLFTPLTLSPGKERVFLIAPQNGGSRSKLDVPLISLSGTSEDRHNGRHGRLKWVRGAGNVNRSGRGHTGVSPVHVGDKSEGLDWRMRGRLTAVGAGCGTWQCEGSNRRSIAWLRCSERDRLLLLLLLLIVLLELLLLVGVSLLLGSFVAVVKRIFVVHISVHETHSQGADTGVAVSTFLIHVVVIPRDGQLSL